MLDVLHPLEAKENSSNWNSSSFAEEARTCSTLFAPSIQEKPVASIELLLTGARTTLTFSDAADYGLIETSGDLGVGIENQPSFSSSSFFFKGLTRLRARATEREREREKQK